jgi:hypothetical protein
MQITRADSVFAAMAHDSLPLGGTALLTDYQIQGVAIDPASRISYNVAFSDGSNGFALFSSTKDTLVITLETFLTTKFGTPYKHVYRVIR